VTTMSKVRHPIAAFMVAVLVVTAIGVGVVAATSLSGTQGRHLLQPVFCTLGRAANLPPLPLLRLPG